MYRRYYSYNDMPKPAQRPPEFARETEGAKEERLPAVKKEMPPQCTENRENSRLFGKFELDDVILGVIILAILTDDGDDSLLIFALIFVFLAGLA